MDGILLAGFPSRSHATWMALFLSGYILREFVSFCRAHPRPRRDTQLARHLAAGELAQPALKRHKPLCCTKVDGVMLLSTNPDTLLRVAQARMRAAQKTQARTARKRGASCSR